MGLPISTPTTRDIDNEPYIKPDNHVTTENGLSFGAVEEFQLMDYTSPESDEAGDHEVKTAPLLTRDAYLSTGLFERPSQYGVLGAVISIHDKTGSESPHDPRLYINTNAPLSALVCGVQGSGKSHTVSVILENMLITGYSPIGASQKPLSALVLHFGEGGPSSRPNETAWLGCANLSHVRSPPVTVFVSRSSLQTMKKVYAPLGKNITVEPLLFSGKELDAEALLSMMAVGSSDSAPLYMQTVLSVVRDLGEQFSYVAFEQRLEELNRDFNPAQKAGLKQRMALLDAFVDTSRKPKAKRFEEGRLTIVDLSDPFVDPAAACGLFEIVTRLFVRAEVGTGKVLVVDEAHKYLAANKGQSGLTKALLSLIRQQRHLAMRVVISTQEPTVVPPVLLDLCSVAILHRFSSPAWWEHVAKHVSANLSDDAAFDQIVRLKTGQAIVLAPAGLGVLINKSRSSQEMFSNRHLCQFGRRYLLIKSRRRITADGGASVLVVDV
ncbi:hypothetical protein AcV7_008333 [Taiwanofungus camphoratus]|nr:hypothetical protein AcV7_008333 [Antrodia cinnamomea]